MKEIPTKMKMIEKDEHP
ncbi:BH2607 [Halalkalibacterium halodurans C-125]|uniref:BH2607 protein n=1 Tax=Halalkalibacterium halodurans (strain ATCC BAA-125 / DSM 18197 / FERM 7344 / JCM 9153 / C-125) TaxID=272558 RepID=Q9K9N8_HALH5|nr:BH2607 [Halalkalibacterium halodurans C-125]